MSIAATYQYSNTSPNQALLSHTVVNINNGKPDSNGGEKSNNYTCTEQQVLA
jgi:hypothetical protein